MAEFHYWLVGDPAAAMSVAVRTLRTQGHGVTQYTAWAAIAEIGALGTALLVGGHAPYIKMQLGVVTHPTGPHVLNLVPETSGALGGLVGIQKTETAVRAATEGLRYALGDAGLLHHLEVTP